MRGSEINDNVKPTGTFERFYYTDEEYHSIHPMLLHRHKDFAELIYVLNGEVSYRVEKRMYNMKPGSMIIVDKNVLHGEEPFRNEHSTTLTLAISNIKINGRESRILEAKQKAVIDFGADSALEKLMVALYELQKVPEPDADICNSLVNVILNIVYTKLIEIRRNEGEIEAKNGDLIRVISKYLDEHYDESPSLIEIGERFGISHYYLAHLFKNETGISPMKYVMHRKIGEVQNLLMNSDLSVKDIGEKLGFSSSCHLSTVFKKYFGISPKTYRQYFKEDGLHDLEAYAAGIPDNRI